MNHELRLNNEPFQSIKSGTKTIELRLYDEKRKLIKVGDTITFFNRANNLESLIVKVVNLHKFKNFSELYKTLDKTKLGYKQNEKALPSDMEQYYSKEEQSKFGVVGIEIEKICE